MTKPNDMTETQAIALVEEMKATGYEFWGGFGIVCGPHFDLSGSTYRNAVETVELIYKTPKSGGEMIVAVNRTPLSLAARREWEILHAVSHRRPGEQAAVFAEETGVDYETALVLCNMD